MALDRLVTYKSGSTATGQTIEQEVSAATPLPVTIGGSSSVTQVEGVKSTTSTTSQVAVTAAAGVMLAANANRLGASIVNTGPSTIYWGETSGVTAAAGFPIPPNSAYNIDIPLYTGAIYGICAATLTATAGVVELTA